MYEAKRITILPTQPKNPVVGDAYYDSVDGHLRIYGKNQEWRVMFTKNNEKPIFYVNRDTGETEEYDISIHLFQVDHQTGEEFIKFRLSAIDRSMIAFEKKVNNHPDMNVKMIWLVDRSNKDKNGRAIYTRGDNDPDYWLGVAYGAYIKKVIDKSELTDVLLALQARGIKSSYFNEIIGKLGRGEL